VGGVVNLGSANCICNIAAKIYYTTHENPERLSSIKSEREIRKELFDVLEALRLLLIHRGRGLPGLIILI
jgi:hypothetical protein